VKAFLDMTDDAGARQRRAQYRAKHRGTKEMDVLLGRYAEARTSAFNGDDLARFERLLALPDPELQSWIFDPRLMGESEFRNLVIDIRNFHGLERGTELE
jgi:antitoxin CptB